MKVYRAYAFSVSHREVHSVSAAMQRNTLINDSRGPLPQNYDPDFLIRKLKLNLDEILSIKIHTNPYLIILSLKLNIFL